MPRAKKPTDLQAIAAIPVKPLVTLRYSAEDMRLLDQFAIGLLRDGTGSYDPESIGLVHRVQDAYRRAEVMLTIHKKIAAQEA